KRGYHQLCFQGFTQLPSYHFSAEEIQDHSQVQPSFHRRNVSNIADPDLVDSTGLQILYQIGHSAISRHCRARSEGLLATRRQFIFTHQPRYSILSAVDPILAKRLAHPGTAVTPFIGCKDSPYLLHQFGLLSLPQSRFGFGPLIIPTAGNPKGFATFLDRIFHRSSPNPPIPGFGSSPTILIAFFKISRCRLRYSTSLCNCRIVCAICSGLCCCPSICTGCCRFKYAFFHPCRLASLHP